MVDTDRGKIVSPGMKDVANGPIRVMSFLARGSR